MYSVQMNCALLREILVQIICAITNNHDIKGKDRFDF